MESTQKTIDDLINSCKVILFMKGSRTSPQCGFSANVINILDHFLPEYKTINVLQDEKIREGIKQYSNWPTIPQLYVDQKFIGGCDIITQLNDSGELAKILNIDLQQKKNIKLDITNEAMQAFKKIVDEQDEGNIIRLSIDVNKNKNLSFDSQKNGDAIFERGDFTVIIDPLSTTRVDYVKIDYCASDEHSGFDIICDDECRVQQISAKQLQKMIKNDEDFELIDVRSEEEHARSRIDQAKLFCQLDDNYFEQMDKNKKIVFQCHSGKRSQEVAERFIEKGFINVANLQGGIVAWEELSNKNSKLSMV